MKLIGLLSCYKIINLLQPMIKNNLFQFIYHRIHKLGIKLIYSVLLMFYAYQSEHTPPWAKRIITGAIAYLLLPLDGLPDLTPFIGSITVFPPDSTCLGWWCCHYELPSDLHQQRWCNLWSSIL